MKTFSHCVLGAALIALSACANGPANSHASATGLADKSAPIQYALVPHPTLPAAKAERVAVPIPIGNDADRVAGTK
jgi:hypothetical protein